MDPTDGVDEATKKREALKRTLERKQAAREEAERRIQKAQQDERRAADAVRREEAKHRVHVAPAPGGGTQTRWAQDTVPSGPKREAPEPEQAKPVQTQSHETAPAHFNRVASAKSEAERVEAAKAQLQDKMQLDHDELRERYFEEQDRLEQRHKAENARLEKKIEAAYGDGSAEKARVDELQSKLDAPSGWLYRVSGQEKSDREALENAKQNVASRQARIDEMRGPQAARHAEERETFEAQYKFLEERLGKQHEKEWKQKEERGWREERGAERSQGKDVQASPKVPPVG